MNPEAFFRQLDQRGQKMGVRFGPQPLMSNSREAKAQGISSAPTSIVDGYVSINGAQPFDAFRAILREVEKAQPKASSVIFN
jgi:protein-disulfide isomerase